MSEQLGKDAAAVLFFLQLPLGLGPVGSPLVRRPQWWRTPRRSLRNARLLTCAGGSEPVKGDPIQCSNCSPTLRLVQRSYHPIDLLADQCAQLPPTLGSASRGLLKYEHTFVVVKVCCHAN